MPREPVGLIPLRAHCRPPEPSPLCVERGRINEQLEVGVQSSRAVEVIAPGGFGKSTALAHWVDRRPGASAWVTLTSHTVNPDRLADLVAMALAEAARREERRGNTALAPLLEIADPKRRAARSPLLVSSWLEALEEVAVPLVLVVDDAHVVPELLSRGPIASLFEAQPSNLTIVVSARAPVVGLDRARAAGETALLDVDALRLRTPEVMELAVAFGHEPTPELAERIVANTGGWPVAVRLDLLTPGATSQVTGETLRSYIDVELLGRLDDNLRHLVMSTTTLERFTGRAAREISGIPQAEPHLDELMRRGMFLSRTPDASGRVWYRWHARFARECREILRERDPDEFVRLARAAVQMIWHLDPLAALYVAKQAEAGDLVRALLADHWLPLLLAGDHEALERAVASLDPTLRRDPVVMVIEAALKDTDGHRTLAVMLLDRAAAEASAGDPAARSDEDRENIRLSLALGRILLSDDPVSLAEACDVTDEMVRTALAPGTAQHNATIFLLGWAELRLRRDPNRALELLRTAGTVAASRHDSLLAVRAHANAAFAAAILGLFDVAKEQLELLGPAVPGPDHWEVYDGGIREFTEGWIAYWTGDLITAEEKFSAVMERSGVNAYAPLARVMYTWVACASGDPRRIDRAEQVRREVAAVAPEGSPWAPYAQMAKAKILAARGAPPHVVAEAALEANRHERIPVIALESAWLLFKVGRTAELVEQLRGLSPLERQPVHVQAGALVINALVQRKRGQHESAHRLLERSLDHATPMGLRRAFDLTVPGMGALLAAHAGRGTAHPEFVASVMATEPAELGASAASTLSARERVILQYMRGTMSNAEIAEALHVSVNTVKTHQRSIYRKFGVATRRDAVKLAGTDTRPPQGAAPQGDPPPAPGGPSGSPGDTGARR